MTRHDNLWDYFCSLGPDGKFIMFATIPMWGPFVLLIWLVSGMGASLYYKAKAQREVAAAMAPSLAEMEHAESWDQQRKQREQTKAAPRPTTNTLYGGIAPTEKL